MQRRKNKKENEREKLFQVKRKKCAQKGLDREDIVRDVRFSDYKSIFIGLYYNSADFC